MLKLIPAATLLALALAGSASAADTTLRFADLDLASTTGQAELAKRITSAASQICTLSHETGTIIRSTAPSKACMADAREQITAQVQKTIAQSPMSGDRLARK
ncbi:MAG: hypothetical protein RLY97_1991 [Pseudomonadota bacterium]|jgi:UrcA family protein